MSAAAKAAIFFVAAVIVDLVGIVTGQPELFYVGNILQAMALGQLITALNGSPNRGGPAPPWQFMANGSTYPRPIIYGATRCSGIVVFQQTSGSKNQYLWYVIAVAGHQLDSMTDVWIDNVNIPSASIDPTTGAISTGKYAGFANIWKYTGTDAQTVDTNLNAAFSGVWDSNHRGRGVAYMVIRLQQDSTTFPTGAPQNFFVTVTGKRLYDPRLDSTNGGSGSQRFTDATTWTFSANPALAAADYITGGSNVFDVATPVNILGMRETTARIDWALVANAANICDQTPIIPGSTTQIRYKLAGVLSSGDSHATNLQKIIATMAGQVVPRGGKYRIYAAAYDAPTLTFTDSDLVGAGYEIVAQGRANLYNAVSPIYVDPTRNYQQVNSAINNNSSYVTADGEKIIRSIDLTLVDDEYRAQRIGALTLAQSRNLISIVIHFGINGFKLSSWDTFNLTLIEPGWVNKVFRVVNWQFAADGPGVDITALEESSAAYSDPLAASYAAPGSATGGANTSDTPNTPLSFMANPIADAIIFTWGQSSYFPGGASYKLWRFTAGTPFSSASVIWQGTSTSYTLPITDATNPTLFYWITASLTGGDSDPIPGATAGLGAKALSITGGFRATCASASLYTAAANGATNSVTCVPTNGTPAYTYAWTYVSGDVTIGVTSSTSATTTFGRTGMVNLTTYNAVWRCTVTDSTAATCHVDIGVTFHRDTSLGH